MFSGRVILSLSTVVKILTGRDLIVMQHSALLDVFSIDPSK